MSNDEKMNSTGPATVTFEFSGSVWHYQNPNTVYFVSVPEDISADILVLAGTSLNPWGTVPVDATVNGVTWYTSMFPRRNGRYYDLPLKLKIVSRLGLVDDQEIHVAVSIMLSW